MLVKNNCLLHNKKVYLRIDINMRYLLPLLISFCCLLSACEPYQKVLKSTDYDYKLKKAKQYYNSGDYFKAIPLFEELLVVYKGTRDVEDLYYFYAYSHYGQKDYLLSAYYFNEFTKSYPKSKKAEDSKFMIAQSYEKLSPKATLEQTNSLKAIEYYQLFVDTYPKSERIEEANGRIDELRFKLEDKAYLGAELYYNMKEYKAAAQSFENLLVDFPDTDRREQVLFMITKAYHELAKNSVITKQEERYQLAIDSYLRLVDNYSESKYLKEAEKIYQSSLKKLEDYEQKKL